MRRDQMASFLIRALGVALDEELGSDTEQFPDVGDANAHFPNVNAAWEYELAWGRADGTYGPEVDVRRDQMATFLTRLLQVLLDPDAVATRPSSIPAALALAPETASPVVATSHTVTAAVTDSAGAGVSGASVRFEVYRGQEDGSLADPVANGTATTSADGTATFEYTGPDEPEDDTVVACTSAEPEAPAGCVVDGSVDSETITGTAIAEWVESAGGGGLVTVALSPSSATHQAGTFGTVTASVAEGGSAVEGSEVRFEVYRETGSGWEYQSHTQTQATGTDGKAHAAYGADEPASDTVVACVLADGDSPSAATPFCLASNDQDPITSLARRSDRPSASATKTWYVPEPKALTLAQESGTNDVGTDHDVTATVKDQFDDPMPELGVRFEVYRDGTFEQSHEEESDENGTATFSYDGPASPATDTIRACLAAEDDGKDDALCGGREPSAAVTKHWVAEREPASLTLAQESDTNPVGTEHEVTATVEDQFEDPVEGVTVRFEVYRRDDDTSDYELREFGSASTGADGQAEFSYNGPAEPAEDMIVACVSDEGGDQELCATVTPFEDEDDSACLVTDPQPTPPGCVTQAQPSTVEPDGELADSATKTWEPAE